MLKARTLNQPETFNDGILKILNASEGIITGEQSDCLRYGIRTVGAIRFYQAAVSGTQIEMLISVPFNTLIKQQDLVEITSFRTGQSQIFKIKQLQIKDTSPRSIYLTLIKDGILYTDKRKD